MLNSIKIIELFLANTTIDFFFKSIIFRIGAAFDLSNRLEIQGNHQKDSCGPNWESFNPENYSEKIKFLYKGSLEISQVYS